MLKKALLGLLIIAIFGAIFYLLVIKALLNRQKPPSSNNKTSLANPASVNCVDKGGKLEIKKRQDGGEYGVCIFPDNRQCEEWAMFRGDCPEGGVKITGYTNEAEIYCAIIGGKITSGDTKCYLPDGVTCNIHNFTDNTCLFY